MSENSSLPASTEQREVSWSIGGFFQTDLFFGILSIVFMILLWQFVASRFYTPLFFPTPLIVLEKAVEMIVDGSLYPHIATSLGRIMAGFVIGSLLGAPIGLLMGTWRPFRAFLDPYIQFFRFIPSIAWLTPAVIWFGIGETSKVLIIVYTTIFIVIINTVVGVSNIPANKLWAARSLGANRAQEFIYVVLPATLPFILTGMRLAMGNSFATVVSAEMIAAEAGLGFLIFNSRLWMATDTIFVSIAVLGFLGLGADRIFRALIWRFAHQYGPAT